MLDLNHQEWKKFKGGYKIPYDASRPLMMLSLTDDPKIIKDILSELWDNLHHQGDVGEASYYAVPHLVDICLDKKSLSWEFTGLCVLIELCRLAGNNPPLPILLETDYFGALQKMEEYLLINFNAIDDAESRRLALSLFAIVSGQYKLGEVIMKMDESMVDEFLEEC